MDNIEFKLNFVGFDYQTSSRQIKNPKCDLFEYKFLKSSSFLLFYAYMLQRMVMFKASYDMKSNEFFDIVLNYNHQILSTFENSYKTTVKVPSQPEAGKEEKFCLVLKFLFDLYLLVMENSAGQCEAKIGEHLVRISNLLVFYGEDVLSNQNPTNDSQSIGSDILSTIGILITLTFKTFSTLVNDLTFL